jgi:hypothetical protein
VPPARPRPGPRQPGILRPRHLCVPQRGALLPDRRPVRHRVLCGTILQTCAPPTAFASRCAREARTPLRIVTSEKPEATPGPQLCPPCRRLGRPPDAAPRRPRRARHRWARAAPPFSRIDWHPLPSTGIQVGCRPRAVHSGMGVVRSDRAAVAQAPRRSSGSAWTPTLRRWCCRRCGTRARRGCAPAPFARARTAPSARGRASAPRPSTCSTRPARRA